jgi:diaminohydroxyphosphoribosylaminopyrimidine deaminase/5-amino-6-(5-phosphoribosylamino)uracil reductase
VLADDPQLNVRDVGGVAEVVRQPLRVVVDSTARIAPQARVFSGGALWVTAGATPPAFPEGVEHLIFPGGSGHVDLLAVLDELGRRGINELHVEAGPKLSGALLHEGLVDELLLYLAPCLIGDSGRGLFGMPGLESLADRPQLAIKDVRLVGADLRVLARLN